MSALTHHGGRIDAAARAWPDAPSPWLDLSTGINPVPWTPPALSIDWTRLPSPDALALLEANAAACFGAPPASVIAVPGTEIALRLLAHLGLPGPFRHLAPSYRTHAEAFPGSSTARVEALPEGGTLLVANPNNPDGRLLDRHTLCALASDRWLVVDEAFADVDPVVSLASILPERTIVLRSFGKFFGLAGVRLGFVIAPAEIVARYRALLGDWPVSAAAIAFGTLAYQDLPWIRSTRIRLVTDAARLDALLRRHGLEPLGTCPLFRLVEARPELFEQLARAGILTRPFDDAPGRVRFGLPAGDAGFDRLDRALGHG